MTSLAIRSGIQIVLLFVAITASANDTSRVSHPEHPQADTSAFVLPEGFAAAKIFESGAENRHIAVNSNGDVYVKLARPKGGKGILVLRDKKGKVEIVNSFGAYGGTGIAIKNGYLYASSDEDVYRYKLNEKNEISPGQKPEKIITGLINRRQHNTKSFTLDNDGNIYVNIGAFSNSCQVKDREKSSLGKDPCPILDSAAGIWQFRIDKLNQSYAGGHRYATGLRNVVGLDWNNSINELYATQHGRDDLYRMFPETYNETQGAELPAEELFRIKKDGNYGWPYCYYDNAQKKKILAPEYGGDSKKQGRCEGVDTPIVAFPAHWAPNALLIYTGTMFPEKYKNGAFIAFHGSWNRAPDQKGYKVVFVPLKDGQPAGDWEVFAEGFMGAAKISSPDEAMYRPCGLAQGPDGSLYISDSEKGAIWKVVYTSKN